MTRHFLLEFVLNADFLLLCRSSTPSREHAWSCWRSSSSIRGGSAVRSNKQHPFLRFVACKYYLIYKSAINKYTNIHSSVYQHLPRCVSWWQQAKHVSLDVFLPSYCTSSISSRGIWSLIQATWDPVYHSPITSTRWHPGAVLNHFWFFA